MHRFRSLISRLTVLGALALAHSQAHAQGVTGAAIGGAIVDPQGAPVPEAQVQLRNTATGDIYNATTGDQGTYFFDNVTPGGPYTIAATSPGYDLTQREGLRLALGERRKLDIPLKYAGEDVVITSFLDNLQNRGRTGAQTSVKEETIAKLPLQGRNFTDLIRTDPRVSGSSVGGQNNRFNNIQIDGGANNDLFGLASSGTPGGQANAKPLSIEAVQEFTIDVAPFDVRQGSFTGGLINAITKSGTNEFHGSVFGYYQNKTFAGPGRVWNQEANQFVTDKSFLGYNILQYGASVGGPIVKDKAHFFLAADLQGRSSSFGNANQMTGDPTEDRARAGFTTTEVDRFVSILTNKYGVRNPGSALESDLANPDRNVFAKVSTNVIPNSRLEVSYNFVNAEQDNLTRAPTSPAIPGRLRDGYQLSNAGYAQANTTHTGRVKLTSTFLGGKLSNEFLAGASIIRDARAIDDRTPLILVRAGSIGASATWLAAGAERFSQANELDQDVYQIQDNVSYQLNSKHRIVVGTSNEFFRFRNLFLQAAVGVWAFNSLDDFDAGNAAAFQRRLPGSPDQEAGTAKFRANQWGLYVQDEWTPLANLRVTPGIRMDVPYLSKAVTNPALVDNAAFPIDTGRVPSGNILWSPRIGFNYSFDEDANTVIRGGVGIFSGRPPYVWVANAYSINGLSQREITCQGANTPAFTANPDQQPTACRNTTPGASANQGEIDYFDPGTKFPQNLKVALGVDRRLPYGLVGGFDFLFSNEVNGWYTTDENLVNRGPDGDGRELYGAISGTNTTFTAATTRKDPARLAQAVKVFNKNGAQVLSATFQLSKTVAQLFSLTAGYTFSKAMDRISMTSSQALSNFQFAPLDGTIEERALRPSAFDRPHRFVLTGTATLPYGFGAGLSYTGQSGTPYTYLTANDVNGDGQINDLVFVPADQSQIRLANPTSATQGWEALNAFIEGQDCLKNARGRFLKRGECRNPWQDFLDLRFSWTSPKLVGEQRVEVQWDIFNVLNLVNPAWGRFNSVAQFENGPSFLRATGYDAAQRKPIYTYTAPSAISSTVLSPTLSRWRMQFGARYTF